LVNCIEGVPRLQDAPTGFFVGKFHDPGFHVDEGLLLERARIVWAAELDFHIVVRVGQIL
jgi:hypothetical protein